MPPGALQGMPLTGIAPLGPAPAPSGPGIGYTWYSAFAARADPRTPGVGLAPRPQALPIPAIAWFCSCTSIRCSTGTPPAPHTPPTPRPGRKRSLFQLPPWFCVGRPADGPTSPPPPSPQIPHTRIPHPAQAAHAPSSSFRPGSVPNAQPVGTPPPSPSLAQPKQNNRAPPCPPVLHSTAV
jgi:hypothetical protein